MEGVASARRALLVKLKRLRLGHLNFPTHAPASRGVRRQTAGQGSMGLRYHMKASRTGPHRQPHGQWEELDGGQTPHARCAEAVNYNYRNRDTATSDRRRYRIKLPGGKTWLRTVHL